MKLIVMRHCKSDWDHHGDDHSRPLNKRGVKSAKALGDWLRAQGHIPTLALVSDATRTRQTWGLLGLDTPAHFFKSLYLAEAGTMLDVLRQNAVGETVLMLGHNPGIAEFAERLVATAPPHDRFWDYPTGATLVADVSGNWSDVGHSGLATRDFIIPREII